MIRVEIKTVEMTGADLAHVRPKVAFFCPRAGQQKPSCADCDSKKATTSLKNMALHSCRM